MIQPGQIYRSCDPRDDGRRIRITEYTPGANRAHAVDADTGLRRRQILVAALHSTGTTQTGAKRRTGYALEAR